MTGICWHWRAGAKDGITHGRMHQAEVPLFNGTYKTHERTVLAGHSAGPERGVQPRGRRVITASFDKTARLWDAAERPGDLVWRGISTG